MRKIGIIIIVLLFSLPVSSQGLLKGLKKAAKTITEKPEAKENVVKGEPKMVEAGISYPTPHKTVNTKVIDGNIYRVGKYYSDGMMAIVNRSLNKLGFIDVDGNIVVECKYNEPFSGDPCFDSGVCAVSRDENGKKRFFIIDKSGAEIMLPATVYAMSQFCDGRAIIGESINNKGVVSFIDIKGKKILPLLTRNNKYSISDPEAPCPLKEGLIGFYDYALEKWGFANDLGKVVIAPQFKEIQNFSEGLAAVKVEKFWGYIDPTGKLVIDYKFYQPSPFSFEKAVIDTNNGYIVINKQGEKISTENYVLMAPFVDGFAFTMKENASKMVVLDNNLKTIREIKNERTLPQKDGYRLAYFDNGMAAVGTGRDYREASGKVVLKPNGGIALEIGEGCGGYIGQFFSDRAICYTRLPQEQSYTTGYINPLGEFVFIIQED